MLGTARSVAIEGLTPTPVVVEAHIGLGLPGFTLLGGAGSAFTQSAERVRAGLAVLGHPIAQRKVVVNLAPADVVKRGARFDLAILVAILRALGEVPPGPHVVLGEVALDGSIRPVPGVLPSMLEVDHAIVPSGNGPECRIAGVGVVVAEEGLAALRAVLRGEADARRVPDAPSPIAEEVPDLADVVGQPEARRAAEVAATGGHHLLLLGPPGAGKSMIARRLAGLLPDLDHRQALTVASVRSVSGRAGGVARLDLRPPFAAPHHSSSTAALLGGGSGIARPGALSHATHGVLFLDELFEWRRGILDGLRQPLEEGQVRIARSEATVTYPAEVLLVAAGNLCPCGPSRSGCRCRNDQVERYRSRLTGPLADRFDLAPTVEPVAPDALAGGVGGETTRTVRARVLDGRRVALDRFGVLNARAPSPLVRATCSPASIGVLVDAARHGRLSARGFDRAMRVARTCADLEGHPTVEAEDALEAVAHRARLDAVWEVSA